jgi:hypothetical protein
VKERGEAREGKSWPRRSGLSERFIGFGREDGEGGRGGGRKEGRKEGRMIYSRRQPGTPVMVSFLIISLSLARSLSLSRSLLSLALSLSLPSLLSPSASRSRDS